MCVGVPGVVLAITRLYLGDTDFNDQPDQANAWKQFGFDVDGKVSTAQSIDLCKPYNGASQANVYPDGNSGIDNSFGRNILPLFAALQPDFASGINTNIATGNFSLLMQLDVVGAAANQSPASGQLRGGANLGHPPLFDGSDCWPVTPELLNDPTDLSTPKFVFPGGALANNDWTSGVIDKIMFTVSTTVGPVTLTIHQARISMTLAANHQSTANGQIGGVLDREELLVQFKTVAGNVAPGLCNAADNQIRQASDILVDGTQDPTKTCTGISIGLGFKAIAVSYGAIAPPAPIPVNLCP